MSVGNAADCDEKRNKKPFVFPHSTKGFLLEIF